MIEATHRTRPQMITALVASLLSCGVDTSEVSTPGKRNAMSQEAWQLCHASCGAPDWNEICPGRLWCDDARMACEDTCDQQAADKRAKTPSDYCLIACPTYEHTCVDVQQEQGVVASDCEASAGICRAACDQGFSKRSSTMMRRQFLMHSRKWEKIQE